MFLKTVTSQLGEIVFDIHAGFLEESLKIGWDIIDALLISGQFSHLIKVAFKLNARISKQVLHEYISIRLPGCQSRGILEIL